MNPQHKLNDEVYVVTPNSIQKGTIIGISTRLGRQPIYTLHNFKYRYQEQFIHATSVAATKAFMDANNLEHTTSIEAISIQVASILQPKETTDGQ